MKRFFLGSLFSAALIGLVGVVGVPAASAATVCPGFVVGTTINDDVLVPAGNDCTILDSTVTGSVLVQPGGTITLVGATVQRELVTTGASNVRVGNCKEFGCPVSRSTVVYGNVSITGTTGVPFFPTKNVMCDATFAGANVVIRNNSAPFSIGADPQCFFGGGNHIGGSLLVAYNTASVTLTGNQVAGALQCVGNSPPPVNGGGNTAGLGKFGQCSAF